MSSIPLERVEDDQQQQITKMMGRMILFSLVIVLAAVQPIAGHAREPRQTFNQADGTGVAPDEENGIIISEPYKTMIKASAQMAVAQVMPSIPEYIGMDATMEMISDAGYALTKPSVLRQLVKPVLATLITLVVAAFLAPRTAINFVASAWRNPESLSKASDWLMNGLIKADVIKSLHLADMELVKKLGLEDSACREQTVCRLGELVRCKLRSSSEIVIDFITYKNLRKIEKKYLKAFLSGFIDQDCGDESGTLSETCASNLVKPWIDCPKPRTSSRTNCKS